MHSLLCLKCCLEVKACVYCTLTTTFNGPFSRTTQVSRYQKGRTHTHPFNGPFSGTTGWMPFLLPNQQRQSTEGKRKVNAVWILLKQETVSGSGISWAIRKSAPRSRQITMPAPHHSVFTGRMPFLLPNQQHHSTEGMRVRWSCGIYAGVT